MPSIINSDNGEVSGSAGLKFTSADDGILNIQNNGNDAITINSQGIASFTNIPLLYVYRSTDAGNQTLTNSTFTKVQFDTVSLDTHSWWDAANYRYVPQIPGYYRFDYAVGLNGASITALQANLYKNGTNFNTGFRMLGTLGTTTAGSGGTSSIFLTMNGTTDYVEIFGLVTASSGNAVYGALSSTWMQAQLIQRTS